MGAKRDFDAYEARRSAKCAAVVRDFGSSLKCLRHTDSRYAPIGATRENRAESAGGGEAVGAFEVKKSHRRE